MFQVGGGELPGVMLVEDRTRGTTGKLTREVLSKKLQAIEHAVSGLILAGVVVPHFGFMLLELRPCFD